MSRTNNQQLVHFLSDMYSVELQALAQLVSAPDLAGEPALADALRRHHAETEQQAEVIYNRLEACGGSPSKIKDAVVRLGGKGFLLFAAIQPETPGKLTAHAYSYEAMEWAGYQMLLRMAEAAGDEATAAAARAIGEQERMMMHRLEALFDAAEQASHRDTPGAKISEHVRTHLADAHGLEAQSVTLLKKSQDIAGGSRLEQIYRRHLDETQAQQRLLEERLEALGSDASAVKDGALGFGGLGWGLFFQAQSDTPAKLAAFVYAFEHLEIGGYELLLRTARRAHDAETEQLCLRILGEERAMCDRLAGAFDSAVQATLQEVHR